MSDSDDQDAFPTPELVVRETGARVPEQQAYLQIARTAETLGADLAALFERHGLSGRQYNALRAIRRAGRPGATPSEIGAQMTDRRSDVTRLVDRLHREGLVSRTPDETDRRVVRVRLSEKGAALLSALDAPLIETHRTHLGHLDPEDLEAIVVLMRKARREA
ncbi:MAG: MarR family winged helix-turn-helix transcriptional regulator [Paracoccaceae bacterium]